MIKTSLDSSHFRNDLGTRLMSEAPKTRARKALVKRNVIPVLPPAFSWQVFLYPFLVGCIPQAIGGDKRISVLVSAQLLTPIF